MNLSHELIRRTFVGVLAFIAFGVITIGILRGGTDSRFGMYALGSGHLELWYARYSWVFSVLWLVGLLSLFVLSAAFVFGGKHALHRRGLVWWLLLLPLCVLILAAIGGRFLPFVDLYSPTDAFFSVLGYYAVYGRGFAVWLVIALLVERSNSWFDESHEAAQAFPGSAAALGVALVVFAGVCAAEWIANTPENRDMSNTPEAGNEMLWARFRKNLVCANTHAVVGQARDFEVVKEPYCWAYDDSEPRDKPDTLQRCQSVQFKVDVLAQYSPWQKDVVPSAVQTMRVWGIRDQLSKIKAALAGPRLFLASKDRVDGVDILRATNRGYEGMSREVPVYEPEWAENPLAVCSTHQRRVEAVRTQCFWDYAVEARATGFNFIPAQANFKGSYRVFPAASRAEQVAEELRRETNPGLSQSLEVSFELVQDLMPDAKRFAPPPKTFKVRVNVDSNALPAQTADYIHRIGMGRREVLHLRADKNEPGVFHLIDKNRLGWPGSIPGAHIDIQLGDTKSVNMQCQAARDALE